MDLLTGFMRFLMKFTANFVSNCKNDLCLSEPFSRTSAFRSTLLARLTVQLFVYKTIYSGIIVKTAKMGLLNITQLSLLPH